MKLFDKFIDIFRKKEFFEVDYDIQNSYLISFVNPSEDNLDKIKNVLFFFYDVKSLNNNASRKYKSAPYEYLTLYELMLKVKEIILEDYRETYFDAIKKNGHLIIFFLMESMLKRKVFTLIIAYRI